MANQLNDGRILPYQYLPIDKSKHETRVFELDLDSLCSDTLRVSMSHVSLDDHPGYYAISYACGDTSDKVPILVNGCNLRIHRTLDIALRNMASSATSRTLWADAICINQSDNDEKSYQVAQMDLVYRQAQSVMIWLGQITHELTCGGMSMVLLSAEGCLQRGSMTYKEYLGLVQPKMRLLEIMGISRDDDETTISMGQELGVRVSTTVLESVRTIFALPWWERAWTIQEYALSQEAEFFIGPGMMAGQIVCSAMDYMVEALNRCNRWVTSNLRLGRIKGDVKAYVRAHEKYLSPLKYCAGRARALNIGAYVQNPTQKLPLRDILLHTLGGTMMIEWPPQTSPVKSTDARDQIFALLSLTSDCQKLNIKPDYSKTCEQVYMDTTRALVGESDIHILSCAESKQQRSQLPSWCVDWSQSICYSLFKPGQILRDGWNYTATLETRVELKTCPLNPGILSLSGVIFDKVKDVARSSFPTGEELFGTLGVSSIADGLDHLGDPMIFLCHLVNLLYLLQDSGPLSQATLEACAVTPIAGKMYNTDLSCEKADVETCVAAFQTTMRLFFANQEPRFDDSPHGVEAWGKYQYAMQLSAAGKRLFTTESGRIGLGPRDVRPSDEVVLLLGARIPYVIRHESELGQGGKVVKRHKLVGETYVHGVMEGEYMATKPEKCVIHLV